MTKVPHVPRARSPRLLARARRGLHRQLPALRRARAVAIPAPALDEPAATPATEMAVLRRRLLLGRAGRLPARRGRDRTPSPATPAATQQTAHYRVVGTGETGHAESVRDHLRPASEITYGKLLQIYFSVAHDPTELNRQGPDGGTQYRSTIFPQDDGAGEDRRRPISRQLDKAKRLPGADRHHDRAAAGPSTRPRTITRTT